MYHPTTRVLTVLELLQSHWQMSGPKLAERLEVDIRSVRRYITMLQELGIPIEAERGRYGTYRLRPGYKLPPLMFTEDEALAMTLGLLAARRLGLAVAAPAIEGALAKVDRVLPATLRERVQAVQEMLRRPSVPSIPMAWSTMQDCGTRLATAICARICECSAWTVCSMQSCVTQCSLVHPTSIAWVTSHVPLLPCQVPGRSKSC